MSGRDEVAGALQDRGGSCGKSSRRGKGKGYSRKSGRAKKPKRNPTELREKPLLDVGRQTWLLTINLF